MLTKLSKSEVNTKTKFGQVRFSDTLAIVDRTSKLDTLLKKLYPSTKWRLFEVTPFILTTILTY